MITRLSKNQIELKERDRLGWYSIAKESIVKIEEDFIYFDTEHSNWKKAHRLPVINAKVIIPQKKWPELPIQKIPENYDTKDYMLDSRGTGPCNCA